MYSYAQSASERGIQVVIAGAGGAAHLPGMYIRTVQSIPINLFVKQMILPSFQS